ncbi:MAG: hypothetical protein GKR89_27310 [Candidatus Latescibacteria bacterium]|nr:hypothetical protein [Candidatus Latescibacterota bacterium]
MKELLQRFEEISASDQGQAVVDDILAAVRAGKGTKSERRLFVRLLILHPVLIEQLATAALLDELFAHIDQEEWGELFGGAVEMEAPKLLVELVDRAVDVGHDQVLRLLPAGAAGVLFSGLKELNAYLDGLEASARLLRGMRVARIEADIYRLLAQAPDIWQRREQPSCCVDSEGISKLKEEKQIGQLAAAYEDRVNQLQRIDLRRCLAALQTATDRAETGPMAAADYGRTFCVRAPLRLGISSANASDNHIRSKEQGGKTLNAGIDLQMEGESRPTPPLRVTARRLPEPQLILRSLSRDFNADFEASSRGDAKTQSALFFAYRRGGDEALRLVKQALVHTGIVADGSDNVLRDIMRFTGGGGLEIVTQSKVMQGSGLGTSSILAAAILKALYRLAGSPLATAAGEYPGLYDQSLLLEQTIGLNSGWQDARGAVGGAGAVKDFYAPPTAGLPAPEVTFLTEIDETAFTERVVLFDTGIARAATRGLNVVLDAYLTRSGARYGAIRESMLIHDEMVGALQAGDYEALGRLATRYWQLRCILDPEATNATLQYLFDSDTLGPVSQGGLITGAGGGGFALLVAREGGRQELEKQLRQLRKKPAYASSGVVHYCLDRAGIQLTE